MNEGDEKMVQRDTKGALQAYGRAMELAPDVTEIKFWAALTMFTEGVENEALKIFGEVFAKEPLWIEVTKRLPAAGLLVNDAGQLDKILTAAPPAR
jgi:tetratricopeptide (TPR) repeat protein